MSNWLLLSILALICWGVTGNTQKLSTNYVSTQFSFLGFALAALSHIERLLNWNL